MEVFTVETKSRVCFTDITLRVADIVAKSGVKSGICTIFIPHTTAGVTINENADPDVLLDLAKAAKAIVPDVPFAHVEGNSDAHLLTFLCGTDKNIIIEDSKLQLGTWQGIYLAEFDGPRTRKVFVKIH